MEYKTDKRTKNLSLRDIHVGDWVQGWEDVTETYSSPLKIIQICDDGFVYLVNDESERDLPFVIEITDIDALPIDMDILVGFGFEESIDKEVYLYGDFLKCNIDRGIFSIKADSQWLEYPIRYFHHLQKLLYDLGRDSKFEWKGD